MPPPQPTIPGVRHYLYKSRMYSQITTTSSQRSPSTVVDDDGSSRFTGVYADDVEARQRLVTTYQTIHNSLHQSNTLNARSPGMPARLVYAVNEHEAVLGMVRR